MSARIQKLINQIGSPEQWSSWIHRSLSPTNPHQSKNEPESAEQTSSKRPEEDSVEDGEASPCVPSVWLRMQSEHLAEPGKKSGSLPRSFNVSYRTNFHLLQISTE